MWCRHVPALAHGTWAAAAVASRSKCRKICGRTAGSGAADGTAPCDIARDLNLSHPLNLSQYRRPSSWDLINKIGLWWHLSRSLLNHSSSCEG